MALRFEISRNNFHSFISVETLYIFTEVGYPEINSLTVGVFLTNLNFVPYAVQY